MSNIKSWADASSDEESDDERIAPPPSNLPGSTSYSNLNNQDDDDDDHEEEELAGQMEKDYSFIFENPPPYTAYIGNLSYDMKTSDEFGAEVEKLLSGRRCVATTDKEENQPVQLRNARLITDRATGASRGYGYIEFDHPQELITFITLTNPQLCGRNVKVDVATGTPREGSERGGGGGGGNRRSENNRNTSGRRESNRGPRGEGRDSNRKGSDQRQHSQKELPKDVGTQFMGGRYAARSDSGSVRGGGGGGGSIKRNDSSLSQGSGGMGGGGGGGDASARQRPSLKLAPRTKPVEKAGGATQASIFGGAKPRDESKFVEKKESNDAEVKEATGSLKAMNVSDESGDANKDSTETVDAKASEPNEKQPPRRQDSKAGGRGGRKDNNGRRDSTRKSGRDGERRGGGRGDKNRGRGEGGRNGKRNSTKSNNGDSNDKSQSSLAAAAAAGKSTPAIPVQTEAKRAPPKKINSFAAFMDDSDED